MRRLRHILGFFGVAISVAVVAWLPLGWLGVVPSLMDVYGIEGLRTPASFLVGGLLIAALGFYEL